jgi:hypothetical protein
MWVPQPLLLLLLLMERTAAIGMHHHNLQLALLLLLLAAGGSCHQKWARTVMGRGWCPHVHLQKQQQQRQLRDWQRPNMQHSLHCSSSRQRP